MRPTRLQVAVQTKQLPPPLTSDRSELSANSLDINSEDEAFAHDAAVNHNIDMRERRMAAPEKWGNSVVVSIPKGSALGTLMMRGPKGIGLMVRNFSDGPLGPIEMAGVKPGWQLTHLNSEDVESIPYKQVRPR